MWRGAPVPGAGGVVRRGGGWRMLHLLVYLAEMAAQTFTLPSVVVYGFLGEGALEGKRGSWYSKTGRKSNVSFSGQREYSQKQLPDCPGCQAVGRLLLSWATLGLGKQHAEGRRLGTWWTILGLGSGGRIRWVFGGWRSMCILASCGQLPVSSCNYWVAGEGTWCSAQ